MVRLPIIVNDEARGNLDPLDRSHFKEDIDHSWMISFLVEMEKR